MGYHLLKPVSLRQFLVALGYRVTTKWYSWFPLFSLSRKRKNQIPCFPCTMATLQLKGKIIKSSPYWVETWTERSQTTGHQRGFREIIFLCYWPEHGYSSLTESSHALVSPRCGGEPPHLPFYPPPPLESKEEDRVAPPLYDWKGDLHP